MLREDAALIARVYAADYARFGYSLPDLAAYPADAMASLRDIIAKPFAAALVRRQRKAYSRIVSGKGQEVLPRSCPSSVSEF